MPKPVHSTGLTGICFFLVEAKLHPYLLVLSDWLLLNTVQSSANIHYIELIEVYCGKKFLIAM